MSPVVTKVKAECFFKDTYADENDADSDDVRVCTEQAGAKVIF